MNEPMAKQAKPRRRDTIARWMYKRKWTYPNTGTIRHRIYDLTSMRHPWYDWGHRLMVIVGHDHCGTWDEFKPEPWFYRLGDPARERYTGFPRHPVRRFEVIVGYSDFRTRTEGLNEDQLYEWQALYADEDGGLSLGHRFWGKPFYGTTYWELPLIRRYLRQWHRRDWYGLRSWLYRQGLHACVHVRRPGACNAVPPKGQGGYDHWHCTLDKRHDGFHRYRNYTWGEIEGEPIGAIYHPEKVRR